MIQYNGQQYDYLQHDREENMSFLKDFKELKKDISGAADRSDEKPKKMQADNIPGMAAVEDETGKQTGNTQVENMSDVTKEAMNQEESDVTVIAAGAVVKENTVIPPNSLVVGIPARIVRTDETQIERIHNQALKYKHLWTIEYGMLPDAGGEEYDKNAKIV